MLTTSARLAVAAAAAVALAGAAPARADSACMADAVRFCPDVPFGDGRVLTCLQNHWSQLSSGCIQDLQQADAKAREITLKCSADIWTYCQGVVPGGGRVRACLLARWDVLSTQCRDEAARLEEKGQRVWAACQDDAARLCAGMRTGGGQVFLCLKAQESKVSGPCQRELR
jgi:hypothetical protein